MFDKRPDFMENSDKLDSPTIKPAQAGFFVAQNIPPTRQHMPSSSPDAVGAAVYGGLSAASGD
jgi:hypothetical protein